MSDSYQNCMEWLKSVVVADPTAEGVACVEFLSEQRAELERAKDLLKQVAHLHEYPSGRRWREWNAEVDELVGRAKG